MGLSKALKQYEIQNESKWPGQAQTDRWGYLPCRARSAQDTALHYKSSALELASVACAHIKPIGQGGSPVGLVPAQVTHRNEGGKLKKG